MAQAEPRIKDRTWRCWDTGRMKEKKRETRKKVAGYEEIIGWI